MRYVNIFTVMAVIAMSTTAQAGGLSDQIVEAPVIMEDEAVAAAPSINPALIVIGVLGALLIAAAVSGDDDDDEEDNTSEPVDEIIEVCSTDECLVRLE